MVEVKTVLCPTDFSECSAAALNYAVDLAARLGAHVDVVHVFQMPIYVGWEDAPAAVTATAQFIDDTRKRSAERLAQVEQQFRQRGVSLGIRQVDGVPHQAIAELSEQADMIVMGTHGRTGLKHLMLGSVAERVVRTAKCPVLTVPEPHAAN